MRALSIGGLVAIALIAGCSDDSAFTCQDDSQCILSEIPGICTDQNQCAYPSDACQSGWEYPTGSAGGLAETCAPGPEPIATGGDPSATSTDSGPSTSSTTLPGMSTSATSTTSAVTDTTTGSPTSASSSSTGPASTGDAGSTGSTACPADESDEEGAPETIPGDACSFDVSGQYHGVMDIDWFSKALPQSCGVDGFSVSPPSDAQTVCIAVTCGVEPAISCSDSDTIIDRDRQLCCASAPLPNDFTLLLTLGAPCEPLTEVQILAAGSTSRPCEPYTVSLEHSD